jgi:hypothetical protein
MADDGESVASAAAPNKAASQLTKMREANNKCKPNTTQRLIGISGAQQQQQHSHYTMLT